MSDLEERIRQRAYDLWDSEGRPEGRQDMHWLSAQAMIIEELAKGMIDVQGKKEPRKPRIAKTKEVSKRKIASA
ncbi:MAG: DUF2934 domain-containing protein [Ancalomicrobiaceae bacterium]|nr:DUF2934 domain-containing protein [Ancalomicrobiaceae bacterium]